MASSEAQHVCYVYYDLCRCHTARVRRYPGLCALSVSPTLYRAFLTSQLSGTSHIGFGTDRRVGFRVYTRLIVCLVWEKPASEKQNATDLPTIPERAA